MKTSLISRRNGIFGLIALGVAAMVQPALADGGAADKGPVAVSKSAWAVMAGTSLKATLEGWARTAGWTLIWDSPVDYRMRASAKFGGDFEEAAASLIDSIYVGNPELMATFHRGNRVLHVENQPLSSN